MLPKMSDVEIVVAQLNDKRDRVTQRSIKDATARLGQLRRELSHLTEERDTLAGAIAELKRRAADAARAVARTEARAHIRKINDDLVALQEMAGPLDECLGSVGADINWP